MGFQRSRRARPSRARYESRGRLTDDCYYLEVGECRLFSPKSGETIDEAIARLKRRARNYRPRSGKAFRVDKINDTTIRWCRVEPGRERKLGAWRALEVGETAVIDEAATHEIFRAAQKTASYLNRSGAGVFDVRLNGQTLTVTRISARRVPTG